MTTSGSLLRVALLVATCSAALSRADTFGTDTFGTGENTFTIDFVTIGDPGNAADTVVPHPVSAPLPSGSVDYVYRMAKYEISEEIIYKANALSNAEGHPLDLTMDVERGPQKPATGLSCFDAARFVNYLNEVKGAPPAYKFDANGIFQLWEPGDPGYDPENQFRNRFARYFLPSADEWHKAAYYDPVNDRYWLYPYGSDEPPVPVASGTDPGTAVFNQDGPADVMLAGGENLFGLVGMAGNIADFEESTRDLLNDDPLAARGTNGGSWIFQLPENMSSVFRNSAFVDAKQPRIGIRVVSVPEPSSLLLALSSAVMMLIVRGQRRRAA
ncbi:formylglycine-generating enzyme family protein [Aeoliella sp. ICT_H6.2]|uniref:Formylglycine-generating enzyme family protein n=1 Tax=Aeoliella straminimaris TaxID=2954799 RepID=A0A9X2F781_9BACT|nr:SUMF1/EgtB/PvdO family nonheme iron enzyme [Aeoliella straminimaris]MCO6042963.1 formylglycine-generating enzyme family protein [Aeoliella straminimaris]